MADQTGITGTLQTVRKRTSGGEVRFGDVVETLENKGFGPVLLVPALIALLPTGAIPGIPSACGLMIFLVAVQMALGKKHPWIPARLRDLGLQRDRLVGAIDKAVPVTRRVDRLFKPRLTSLSDAPLSKLFGLLCAVFGLSMIPLELVPFAAAVPALAIVLVAIGLSTRDGIVLLLAGAVFAAAGYLLIERFL